MFSDMVILATLTALNLASVTAVTLVTHDIPSVLATTLTTLIGATAGVAVTGNRVSTVGAPVAVTP